MSFFEFLFQMLCRHEGYRLRPYKCTSGKWTIGIGFNFSDNPLPEHIQKYLDENGVITDEMVMELYEISVNQALRDCHRLYPQFDSFSERRRAALVDFVFNLGFNRASKFVNTNKAINEQRWWAAAYGIKHSLYWKQLGGDPEGTDDGKLERPEEIYEMILGG